MSEELITAEIATETALAKTEEKGLLGGMSEEEAWGFLSRGDWALIPAGKRGAFLIWYCRRLDLDPLTKPFDFLTLNGKTVIYATKGCADQIRRRDNISVEVLEVLITDEIVQVRVKGTTPDNRTDEEIGAVANTGNLIDKANNRMKALTKAKRRLVLSMAGLGMPDESELEGAVVKKTPAGNAVARKAPAPFAPTQVMTEIEGEVVNTTTGEVMEAEVVEEARSTTTSTPVPAMTGTSTVTRVTAPAPAGPRRLPPMPPPAKVV